VVWVKNKSDKKNTQVGDFGVVAQNSKSSQKTMDAFLTKKKTK
jgi:hypothetical protein